MVIRLYEENTNIKQVREAVEIIRSGGIVVYPTDTIYAIGCALDNIKGMDKIIRITNKKGKNHEFSLICHDLSQLSGFTKPIPNATFKLLKRNLPGPFTFVLPANNQLPKVFKQNRKTVGIRIPNNNITLTLARELGMPIASASIRDEDEIVEYTTDPELIYKRFEHQIDLMIDGGYGGNHASTVVDCSSEAITILRQGAGQLID